MKSCSRVTRLPDWIRDRPAPQERFSSVQRIIRRNGLFTVCEEASCPNRPECWNSGTATFMILGGRCTRACRFCGVEKGFPLDVDDTEPERVAGAVKALRLRYTVVTSVTRDDLPDGGAEQFSGTVRAIRAAAPSCRIEVLVPDFQGDLGPLQTVIRSSPDVLSHNVETVPSLYCTVRPAASYERSLDLIAASSSGGIRSKSGLMVGLGETLPEIRSVLRDLANAGCSFVTVGQYLQPGRRHIPVERYYHPEEFAHIEEMGRAEGLKTIIAGPLIRSSYHAEEMALRSRTAFQGDTNAQVRP